MSIEGKEDLDGLREAGRIVRAALEAMKQHVRPGITTAQLNAIGAAVLRENGARSAPMLVYGFPREVCISINEEIIHGIPSERVVEEGDLVKLDVTIEKNGYMADAAITVAVEPVTEEQRDLVECAQRAFFKAMQVARVGNRVSHIGRAVEHEVRRWGFDIVRDFAGHGIGRSIHEEPSVPNYYDLRARARLTRGLVLTVEPMVTMGAGAVVQADDGWTIQTADGSMAAHYEQTIVITKGQPILLTAAA